MVSGKIAFSHHINVLYSSNLCGMSCIRDKVGLKFKYSFTLHCDGHILLTARNYTEIQELLKSKHVSL